MNLITNGTAVLTNRTGGARNSSAVWVPGTTSTASFAASCQPDKGAQFAAFQTNGTRQITYVKLFLPPEATVKTEAQVGPAEATTFTHPEFPDITFRVTGVDRRIRHDPPHLLARAVSISEAEARA